VGQLESVTILKGDETTSVYVKTGLRHGDEVEVLSGLNGGETLMLELGNAQ
jgi:hypothetical protein